MPPARQLFSAAKNIFGHIFSEKSPSPLTSKGVKQVGFEWDLDPELTLIFEGCSSVLIPSAVQRTTMHRNNALECKPDTALPLLQCLSALCTAPLTLASVVTGLLEEYIQWAASPPPHPIYYLPRIYLWKRGGVWDLCIGGSLSFPFFYRFTQPREKGAECFFASEVAISRYEVTPFRQFDFLSGPARP